MERSRLIINFDSSCDKLLSTENVVACGETFDILFRDVTLSGTVRVAFWDHETLLWRSEGSASQGDGGSVLEGLVADTKELADVFRGGSGFFAARLTVGEQVGGNEWRDYGVAYVRLYSGTDPSENPPPARPDVYPTEDELNAWLEVAGEVREGVCTCAKAAASSAEAAASSARLAAAQALDAAKAANDAKHYASDASDASISAAKSYENAEASRKAADSAAQVARDARENAQLQQQKATAAAGNANGYRQQAANSQRLAERAQEKAEAAQQAAETARDQADQSAQEAGQKADEANQSAQEAGSANSSAQSAKAAAEQAKQDAVQARDNAQTAKQGAQAAKDGAESAKASAEAAAEQAATSATNAAQSATVAQEAAQSLQEGLATLNTLDGRVTFLESGEGVYKNPTTGKVTTFTPLPGSDGTLKVIKELPDFYKVTPMEEDISNTDTVVTSDGIRFVIGVVDHLYFYDSSLNRMGKWHSNYCRMEWNRSSTGSGRYALWEHADGHLRCVTQDNNNSLSGKIYLYDVTAGAVLKAVTKPIASFCYNNESIYNLASGHILTRHNMQTKEDGTPDFFWLLWDADLNPVPDEATGAQKRIDANAVFDKDLVYTPGKLFEWTPVRVMQMSSEGKTLITSTRSFDWGERGNNVGLWTFGADDLPIQIMEHAPVEDPERPGYCQCEKNEDGTIKREWDDDRNCYFPRLVTQELGPALFKRSYPAEYGLSAGGNGNGVSGLPFMMQQWNMGYRSMLRDNCFRYILTHDNKLINTAFVGNYRIATAVRQPAFTYKFPLAQAANYGKYKFPANAGDFMNIMLPEDENSAILYAANTGKDNINLMARSGSWNFTPDSIVRYPFSPLTLNKRGGVAATLKINGMTFFGVPTWCTNKTKIVDGVL